MIPNSETPMILGPLTNGHYIPVAGGLGFYVGEETYQECKRTAVGTGRVQFLGVSLSGEPLRGTREDILEHPESCGCIAWITPED